MLGNFSKFAVPCVFVQEGAQAKIIKIYLFNKIYLFYFTLKLDVLLMATLQTSAATLVCD